MRFVERILAETEYKKWIPTVSRAIKTMFQGEDAASGIGQTVYDADCLDKLGHMGVAQFFSKEAQRRRFLDEKPMILAGIGLTYAHHTPQTLKTATGRRLACQRKVSTRRFFNDLLEEWQQLCLGDFHRQGKEVFLLPSKDQGVAPKIDRNGKILKKAKDNFRATPYTVLQVRRYPWSGLCLPFPFL